MQLTVKKRGNNPIHPVEEIPDRPYAGKRASPHEAPFWDKTGSLELEEAVWISEQCGSVRLNSSDQLTEQKQWCGLLPQNRANNGYLLFYKKFSRNIDFYGR